ncbi:uncharacterized protein LOC116175125 isoform X2 [Photinus pyralis]|nr:uncharacterized protein LOC116175125 isoform X2 [Photinus pyralis]XP_031349092.1 uncharacterized protein LOC116175125 isoform X2 [Photinus pyralis]
MALIPDELKLLIFKHLDSFNIITLENVSHKLKHLSFDKQLLRSLYFCRDYRLTTCHWLRAVMPRLEIITSLNINCVYWISRRNLTRCLSLPMLTSLYALDTKLQLYDICSSNLTSLNVLALTVKGSGPFDCPSCSVLNNLKRLCVILDRSQIHSSFIRTLMEKCMNVEELWFLDLCSDLGWYLPFSNMLPMKVLVTTYQIPPIFQPALDIVSFQSNCGIARMRFENRHKETADIYNYDFYEKISNTVWHTYLGYLRCNFPFGVEDAKKLVYQEVTFDNINFKELSLHHGPSFCCSRLKASILSILRLPNTKFLQKLSINICIFTKDILTADTGEPLSEKGLITFVSHFDRIAEHSPLIEELEVWECISHSTIIMTSAIWSAIGKLSNLKKLFIFALIPIDDQKCLFDICKKLTSLKLTFAGGMHEDLSLILPNLKILRDFRFEQKYLPLDRILKSLASNCACTLERVVLLGDVCDTLSPSSFEAFITNNPQLKLLYVCISTFSKDDLRLITTYLNRVKMEQQIFIVTNSNHALHLVPDSYVIEMVQINSAISVIDIFNDFH